MTDTTTNSTTDEQSTFDWSQRELLRRTALDQGVGSEKADELVTQLTTENPTSSKGRDWAQLLESMRSRASTEAGRDSLIGMALQGKGKNPQR
ncbi:hypothetical protein I204_01823 [Kwoniella mangroviensis CBS 8886]|nr:hypothetical protein I204_01823 [Kwoniella mangroviensis CBS 8886]